MVFYFSESIYLIEMYFYTTHIKSLSSSLPSLFVVALWIPLLHLYKNGGI